MKEMALLQCMLGESINVEDSERQHLQAWHQSSIIANLESICHAIGHKNLFLVVTRYHVYNGERV